VIYGPVQRQNPLYIHKIHGLNIEIHVEIEVKIHTNSMLNIEIHQVDFKAKSSSTAWISYMGPYGQWLLTLILGWIRYFCDGFQYLAGSV